MIGKIGVHNLNQVRANQPETTVKPAFKGNDEFPQISELRGSEMLANYSVAFINKMPKEKLELNELPQINAETSVDNIDGEKIYTSDGKLDSIVVEDENTTTIYYPSEGDANFITQVKVIDKATGKKILSQENDKNGSELTQYIYKFSKEGDKEIIESSTYEQGKYVSSWKDSIDGDRCESISKYKNDYTMSFSDKKNYKRMEFDKNGQLVEVYTSKQMPNGEINQRVGFMEGELYKASKEKEIYFKRKGIDEPIPFGLESLGNKNLIALLPSIFHCIEQRGMLLLDEFSSGFHNELEELLIRYFMRKSSESQLIFVSHSTNLISNSLIRPDQIYSVDFGKNGSYIKRFSSEKPREAQNLEKMYLSGVFNGVPNYEYSIK